MTDAIYYWVGFCVVWFFILLGLGLLWLSVVHEWRRSRHVDSVVLLSELPRRPIGACRRDPSPRPRTPAA